MRLWVVLLLVFGVLFTTRILLPLSSGPKAQIIEQNRPVVPQPLYQSSLEREDDEKRFEEVVAHISNQTSIIEEQVRVSLLTALDAMQEQIPFNFSGEYYSLACLPDPTDVYEVHKRIHLGDTALGMPIYADVRVYSSPFEAVCEALLTSAEATFVQKQVEEGVCFIGYTSPPPDLGHGIAKESGERMQFFHLIEKEGSVFVAYIDAPREDLSKLYSEDELVMLTSF